MKGRRYDHLLSILIILNRMVNDPLVATYLLCFIILIPVASKILKALYCSTGSSIAIKDHKVGACSFIGRSNSKVIGQRAIKQKES